MRLEGTIPPMVTPTEGRDGGVDVVTLTEDGAVIGASAAVVVVPYYLPAKQVGPGGSTRPSPTGRRCRSSSTTSHSGPA